ncbi:hypothetical protein DNH61_17645 [Paenibacillus sambharensis]|uniref:Uncharacterized protein n=1 Tax=Paenibacillus sambharensis TaxID=1803190 RepID=A0A2W1L6U5_9BACL|nr:hypothetical protein [Paenibacillus sambharensis]PZD94539.1 hypothetical protein DNH61_17645 [Paenibacillus sambharensis]
MRTGYSVLRELKLKNFIPTAGDYGLKDVEFENFIRFLERKGFIERVLWVKDAYSLRPARLTPKGLSLLEEYSGLESEYPAERTSLKPWVELDKILYSNGAEEAD